MNPPYDAHYQTHWASWVNHLCMQPWKEQEGLPSIVREATLWQELIQRLRRATGAAAIVPTRLSDPQARAASPLALPLWRDAWHEALQSAPSGERPLLPCWVVAVGEEGHALLGHHASAVWQGWHDRPRLVPETDWPAWLADLPGQADWTQPAIAISMCQSATPPSASMQQALHQLLSGYADWLRPLGSDPEATASWQWTADHSLLQDFLAVWRQAGGLLHLHDGSGSAVTHLSGWRISSQASDTAETDPAPALHWHWQLDHPEDALKLLAASLANLRKHRDTPPSAVSLRAETPPPSDSVPASAVDLPSPSRPAQLAAKTVPCSQARLLVLLHGAMQGPEVFLPMREHLDAPTLAVWAPQLSTELQRLHDADRAQVLPGLARQLLDRIAQQWPHLAPAQWSIAGHSMGSLLALEMARQAGGPLASLCLMGTACPMPVSAKLLEGARRQWARTQASIHWASLADPEHVSHQEGYAPLQTQALHAELMGVGHPADDKTLLAFDVAFSACDQYRWPGDWPVEDPGVLAHQRCIIQGRDDRMTRLVQAEQLARHLQAELHSVDAGHALLLEAPQAVGRLLGALLA